MGGGGGGVVVTFNMHQNKIHPYYRNPRRVPLFRKPPYGFRGFWGVLGA